MLFRRFAIIPTILFALMPALPAQAQQAPPTYGAPITLDAAKKVMAAAEAEAKKNNWAVAIAILDTSGYVALMERLDNTQYGSISLAEDKARTALNFKRSTKVFQDNLAKGGENLRYLAMDGITAVQGAVPIVDDGKIVGAIGVSGATAEQDEQVAMAGAAVVGKR